MNSAAKELFSSNVAEADAKFTQAAYSAGQTPVFRRNRLEGPNNEPLNVGVVTLGRRDAKNALLVLSGEHGVEGFGGSAVQVGALHNSTQLHLGDNLKLVFVHLINPWGCAWSRRENEDNVDLFRNFTYCEQESGPNPLYDELNEALNPREWTGAAREAADRQLECFMEQYGRNAVIAAVRQGQHSQPKGLTYHGSGPTWSKLMMDEILREHCSGIDLLCVLNLHTGYGDYGRGQIFSYEPQGSASFASMARWLSEEPYVPGDDPFIPKHSLIPWAWAERVTGAKIVHVGLEFGTFPPADAWPLLRANSYYHNYGDPRSAGIEVLVTIVTAPKK